MNSCEFHDHINLPPPPASPIGGTPSGPHPPAGCSSCHPPRVSLEAEGPPLRERARKGVGRELPDVVSFSVGFCAPPPPSSLQYFIPGSGFFSQAQGTPPLAANGLTISGLGTCPHFPIQDMGSPCLAWPFGFWERVASLFGRRRLPNLQRGRGSMKKPLIRFFF